MAGRAHDRTGKLTERLSAVSMASIFLFTHNLVTLRDCNKSSRQ